MKKSIFTVLIILLLQAISFSQGQQGKILGTVTDTNGAIVPGATVTIRNEKTGEVKTVTTSAEGDFQVVSLRPSTYTVSVSADNFEITTKNGLELLAGQDLNLSLILKPKGVTAQVDIISGEESALNTSSASMSVNVTPREVNSLPLNGRQLSQLYLQAPGAQNSGSGTFGDIRFNGRAVEQNIIRYDGIEGTAIIDASPGNLNGEIASPFRLQVSLENVQEFRVESSSYPAEFGTGTGGQISVITKSGGNQFKGSLFEYFRNDALDAANFFDNIIGQKSPLRLNQFGGSFSGPIIKNKLFFFGSYEAYRLRAGINSIEAVPGDAARICSAPGVTCNPTTVALLPAFRDPKAVIISRGSGANLFDVAQLQDSARVDEDSFAFRLDYTPTQKDALFLRFFRDEGRNRQPEGVTGRRLNFTAVPQNAVLGWQKSLTANVINEFKLGFNWAFTRTNGEAPTFNGIDLSRITLNITGNTANFQLPGQGTSAGTATPGGLIRANSATNGRGQPYTAYSISFMDNVTWIKANHTFKFGFEFRPIRLYTDRLGGTTYVFNTLPDFLANRTASIQYVGDLSDPSPFTGVSGVRLAMQEYYIGYVQDEWKITPELTLNYGLRYEYYTPLRERKNGQVLFDITNGTLRPSNEKAFNSKKNSFGPRVGIAWAPKDKLGLGLGRGRSVFRAGFGIYYGPGQLEDLIQPIESDRISSTVSGGSFDPNINAFIASVRNNFINNPNNRNYQPRAYAPEYSIPEKIYTFTVSYQQELPYGITATVAYIGSRGRNLFLRGLSNVLRDGNAVILNGQPLPSNAGVINRTDSSGNVIGVTTVRQFDILNNPSACNLSPTTTNPLCRPYAEIDFKTSGGTDRYDAFQLTLTRRISRGLTMNAQYVLGKSFGNTSGSNEARTASQPVGGTPRPSGDQNNYEADRSYNNFDIRHNFNLSAVYDLPIGKGKAFDIGKLGNALLGDWELGVVFNARSGIPIDVTVIRPDVVIQCVRDGGCAVPTNASGATTLFPKGFTANLPSLGANFPALPPGFIAVINSPGGGSSRQTRRPNLVPGVSPYLKNDRNYLNPAAFSLPAPGTFGNLPRNALRGPNFYQVDLVLGKRFRISERIGVQFRTEVFNLFNRANFANPSSTLNNPLPNFTYTPSSGSSSAFYTIGGGLQPGEAFTPVRAGSTFGLLRQTVERTVGFGTNRQIQFALRLDF